MQLLWTSTASKQVPDGFITSVKGMALHGKLFVVEETVSRSDVLVLLVKTRSFLGHCKDAPDDVHRKAKDVEAFVLQRLLSTRQKTTDFFKQINCS